MFYVYYGYASPDHYDSSESPTYEIAEYETEEEVLKFYKEFQDEYIHDDCENVIFRIFEGSELKIEPKVVVTEYQFG